MTTNLHNIVIVFTGASFISKVSANGQCYIFPGLVLMVPPWIIEMRSAFQIMDGSPAQHKH
jgi:hypothetical protein